MSKYELPEDVSLYLLSVAGSDVSGAALALCRKYMPEVVEAYMESSQESPKSGIEQIREAIKRDRGGDAPPQIQGYA